MRKLIPWMILLCAVPVFAGPLRDAIGGAKGLSAIAGLLGLGALGALGVIGQARIAIEEIMQAVQVVKQLVHKYKNLAGSDEVKEDLLMLQKELDDALEATALVVERLRFLPRHKSIADRLRGAL